MSSRSLPYGPFVDPPVPNKAQPRAHSRFRGEACGVQALARDTYAVLIGTIWPWVKLRTAILGHVVWKDSL